MTDGGTPVKEGAVAGTKQSTSSNAAIAINDPASSLVYNGKTYVANADNALSITPTEAGAVVTLKYTRMVTTPPQTTYYLVTYDYNGGEGTIAVNPQAYQAGTVFDVEGADKVSREGYEFKGWLCDYDLKTYAGSESYEMPEKNILFVAQWEEEKDIPDPSIPADPAEPDDPNIPDPSIPVGPGDNDNPQTGDGSNSMLYLILLGVAVVVAFAAIAVNRKRVKQK